MAMLRTDDAKYLRYEPAGTEVLYDLKRDPDELHNVAARADYAPQLAALRNRLLTRALQASASARPRLHPY
jgi:arylsulfatase A-like enzyme